MASAADPVPDPRPPGAKRRALRMAAGVGLLLLFAALALGWLARVRLADDLIERTLHDYGVEASYSIESIAPRLQVLTDIVVGDPARPDLTIERVELRLRPRFGLPAVTDLRLVRPRLFGTQQAGGRVSFGALDPVIYTDSEEPLELPDLSLTVEDGRALVETLHGRIGLKLAGSGHLRSGFAGELAAVAPALALGSCRAGRTTLFGRVSIDNLEPHFSGPLRVAGVDCAGITLAQGRAQLDLAVDRNLADADGNVSVALGAVAADGVTLAGLAGDGAFSWRDAALTASYDLAARGLALPLAQAASATLEGRLRAEEGFTRVELEGDLGAAGLAGGEGVDVRLAALEQAAQGTLLAPLLGKLRSNLAREMPGSTLAASYTARAGGANLALVIPQARLAGGSGATLLSLSRAQMVASASGLPRFQGNFVTGGAGLPQIAGRMEQPGDGGLELRLRIAEYAAGDSWLAVPDLTLRQGSNGALSFAGRALAEGPLPGGFARALELPLDGTYGADGTLALWQGCRSLRFAALSAASLSLGREAITLCPPPGRPILRYGAGGLQLAAGTRALALEGELAGSPLKLASGPVGLAWPGQMNAREVEMVLGAPDSAQRFRIARLDGELSPDGAAGTFDGADVMLAAVPLDIGGAGGEWRFAAGRLDLSESRFLLSDREARDRFTPLMARGASLAMVDGRITADAVLRHPASDIALAQIRIAHLLESGTGGADFAVDGVTFAPGLQPVDLSPLALGVVANVAGEVRGSGRIGWSTAGVTSNGSFNTDSLDLAAAFGPVQGASGTVVFTDLLGMTTAPGQRVRIASINPGIEVNDGEVSFSLTGGRLVQLESGSWPFMGGMLRLQPLAITIGAPEERRWVLEIDGLDAARFIEHMELGNLAASGIFDGTIPIVFDRNGNGQLENGVLRVRAPGGHLSYVGAMTYEDAGWASNLAFAALRDMRFNEAEVVMNGPLTGELVTQVRFEGIRQGETARQNLITRRLSRLPIRLLVNVRAPFYRLIESMKSLYDPASLRDPRSLGLMRDDGTRLRNAVDQSTVEAEDAARAAAAAEQSPETDIQPPESEAVQ